MKRIKTVRVKKFSKKTGQLKVYTYKYAVNKQYNKLVVTKAGKINEKVLNRVLEGRSISEQAEIKAVIRQHVSDYAGVQNLSERSLLSKAATNRIEKMIINTGYTSEELANELGVTKEALLDKNNWNNDIFTGADGKQYKFVFNYEGDVVFEVTK